MTKEERASKDDLHLDALELFANWYCEQRLKNQELIKRVKK